MSVAAGYAEAVGLASSALSPRAQFLATLLAVVEGTQYAGRKSFWDDSVPLWERAPCIVIPMVKGAIDSNADLVLGEGRFPVPRCGDAAIDTALQEVAQKSRLQTAARDLLEYGQAQSSGVSVVAVRGGRIAIDSVRADWCTPTFASDGSVTSLEISYPYVHEEMIRGERVASARMFKRVIDAVSDTTFLPAEIGRGEPKWIVDKSRTVEHGLGFCPVVWFAHMRGCSIVNRFDGRAIHETVLDELEAIDFAHSQRHRAALYAADPQWTETGVEPGTNPSDAGRMPRVVNPSSRDGGAATSANPRHNGGYIDGRRGGGKVRRKGPGVVWQYENPAVRVQLHTLPGDALKALDDHIRDLRLKVAEALGVVLVDPTTMPRQTSMSGRFVESFKRPQMSRCDRIRADFGDNGLVPLWAMALRIGVMRGVLSGVTLPSWPSWHNAPIDLVWGAYRQPDPDEKTAEIKAAVDARSGGLATLKVAVTMVRDILGVQDVDAYLDELAEESAPPSQAPDAAPQVPESAPSGAALEDDNEDDAATGEEPTE